MSKKELRLVHILSGDLWAGAEVMAINLIRELSTIPDCFLTVVLLNEGKVAESLKKLSCEVVILDETKLSFCHILLKCRKTLKKVQPQVVHTHRYKENLIGLVATKSLFTKTPLVATLHGMPEFYGNTIKTKNKFLQKLNFLMLARCFDMCIPVSEEIVRKLTADYKFSSKKVLCIHNGIQVPTPLKKNNQVTTIGSCGRLTPVKNYTLFVKLSVQILSETKNVHFILAGDGPEKERLWQQCTNQEIYNFWSFWGHTENIDDFYNKIDVYINTSLHEGVPMSILEAMGHGIPVVAPAVGGITEIIVDGVDGFLIAELNPDLFAKKCLQLLLTPGLSEKMGKAARKKIKRNFSAKKMAEEYYQLYQNILIRQSKQSANEL